MIERIKIVLAVTAKEWNLPGLEPGFAGAKKWKRCL